MFSRPGQVIGGGFTINQIHKQHGHLALIYNQLNKILGQHIITAIHSIAGMTGFFRLKMKGEDGRSKVDGWNGLHLCVEDVQALFCLCRIEQRRGAPLEVDEMSGIIVLYGV